MPFQDLSFCFNIAELFLLQSGNSKDDICLELERDEDFNFDRSNEAEVVRREFDPNNSTGYFHFA